MIQTNSQDVMNPFEDWMPSNDIDPRVSSCDMIKLIIIIELGVVTRWHLMEHVQTSK